MLYRFLNINVFIPYISRFNILLIDSNDLYLEFYIIQIIQQKIYSK